MERGKVCVTGGTGYLASWLINTLLQHGYSVNTTIRSTSPENQRDISYITNLPGASERLRIFHADLDKPEGFDAAIEGCIGVFHVAHPMEFADKEPEATVTQRAIRATLHILRACLNSGTVKRVVYTSSIATVMHAEGSDVLDENCWSDVEVIRSLKAFGGTYAISKTLTERKTFEFAEEHGLDVVSVLPSWIHGPFVNPSCPGSVRSSLSMIFGDSKGFKYPENIPFVHVNDVARAHIFLFENPNAKGRYICSALEISVDNLAEFLRTRYPEYQISDVKSRKLTEGSKYLSFSSKKLLDAGFKYEHGLEDMFDEAIECCKQRGLL